MPVATAGVAVVAPANADVAVAIAATVVIVSAAATASDAVVVAVGLHHAFPYWHTHQSFYPSWKSPHVFFCFRQWALHIVNT